MKIKDVVFKIAETRQELEDSYKLVCRRYKQQGYLPEDWHSDCWLNVRCAVPGSITIVGKIADEVIATVTLFPDSVLGFPLEDVFSQEVASKRVEPLQFWEIGMLGVSEEISPTDNIFNSIAYLGIVMSLFKSIYDVGDHLYKDSGKEPGFFIAVVESHVKFYKMLGFDALCPNLRLYGKLRDVYAMCLFQKLSKIRETAFKHNFLRKFILMQMNVADNIDKKYKWSCRDVIYFLKERTNLWEKLAPEERSYIVSVYCEDNVSKEKVC